MYWENRGFDAMENTWKDALGTGGLPNYVRANATMGVTWNDIAEHNGMQPSPSNGWALLDFQRYYIEWFKKGSPPTITQDAIYMRHRRQFHGDPLNVTTYTGMAAEGQIEPVYQQTSFIDAVHESEGGDRRGSTPVTNEVNMRVFVKGTAGDLIVSFDGVDEPAVTLQPGLRRVAVPLKLGKVRARLVRGTTVAAKVEGGTVSNSQPVQNIYELSFGSIRQALGHEPVRTIAAMQNGLPVSAV